MTQDESPNLLEATLKKIDNRLNILETNQKFNNLRDRVTSERKSKNSRIGDDNFKEEILNNSKRIDDILRIVEDMNENLQNDDRIKHLELFQKSQYSCNEFILQKVSTNSKRIEEIFRILEKMQDQLGGDDASSNLSGMINLTSERGEANVDTGVQGEKPV